MRYTFADVLTAAAQAPARSQRHVADETEYEFKQREGKAPMEEFESNPEATVSNPWRTRGEAGLHPWRTRVDRTHGEAGSNPWWARVDRTHIYGERVEDLFPQVKPSLFPSSWVWVRRDTAHSPHLGFPARSEEIRRFGAEARRITALSRRW